MKRITGFTFSRSHDQVSILKKPLPEKFDRNLAGLRNTFFSDLSTYRKSASPLSAVLIPEISRRISDRIIIPDAKLGTIPFETLFTADATKDHTFQTPPYLIDQYSIRYEFSSGLIIQKGCEKILNHFYPPLRTGHVSVFWRFFRSSSY